jgi:TPR repeat protein
MKNFRAVVVAAVLAVSSTQIVAADEPAAGTGQGETARAEAMNRWGIRYATGKGGVTRDYVAALAWYRLAAENGSTSAMNNIATMYFHGLGVAQSYDEAAKWLRMAVQRNDAVAQNSLGTMYANGLGVAKSDQDAFDLFRLAATQGYAPAMVNLGRVYASGSGVKQDEIHAYALFTAAMQIGLQANERDAAIYQLGALSQRLDEKQLERAQADAHTLIEMRTKESPVEVTAAREAYRL